MGKKSASTPDTVGAAKQQGIEDRTTARDATYADRPDQYNPFGSLTWGQQSMIDPATGEEVTKWTQGQALSPDMQNIFDREMDFAGLKSLMQNDIGGRIVNEMGGAPDWEQFGNAQGLEYDPTELRQRAEDAAYGRMTSRLDPRFQQEGQSLEVDLRNKGLRAGDEAYDAAMGNYGRTKTDAYEQAAMGAIGMGKGEAQQLYDQQMGSTNFANALRDKNIQEYLDKRTFSLNEAERLSPVDDLSKMSDAFGGGNN